MDLDNCIARKNPSADVAGYPQGCLTSLSDCWVGLALSDSYEIKTVKEPKGVRWIPRRIQPKKDAAGSEMLWGVANTR